MGIDLRQNPQVVAVDPSVIPLGSMVEVSGYGSSVCLVLVALVLLLVVHLFVLFVVNLTLMKLVLTIVTCAESVNTFFTAMGIDLRQNPQVVAVDPSVIPLGQLLNDVPIGYIVQLLENGHQ
jgi:3D (Asp-Asp-Asp) domain-containing protein